VVKLDDGKLDVGYDDHVAAGALKDVRAGDIVAADGPNGPFVISADRVRRVPPLSPRRRRCPTRRERCGSSARPLPRR